MKSKALRILKIIITIILIVPWSIIIILLLQIKAIVSETPKVEKIPIIEVADTIVNKEPNFIIQTPEEGLEEALKYYDIKHSDIVYAQAVLETGNFKSRVCKEYNNLFGLYDNKAKDYYKFKHWSNSIEAYRDMIQCRYKYPNNYYVFLRDINYAEDPEYIEKIKEIKKQNDKRRSK